MSWLRVPAFAPTRRVPTLTPRSRRIPALARHVALAPPPCKPALALTRESTPRPRVRSDAPHIRVCSDRPCASACAEVICVHGRVRAGSDPPCVSACVAVVVATWLSPRRRRCRRDAVAAAAWSPQPLCRRRRARRVAGAASRGRRSVAVSAVLWPHWTTLDRASRAGRLGALDALLSCRRPRFVAAAVLLPPPLRRRCRAFTAAAPAAAAPAAAALAAAAPAAAASSQPKKRSTQKRGDTGVAATTKAETFGRREDALRFGQSEGLCLLSNAMAKGHGPWHW